MSIHGFNVMLLGGTGTGKTYSIRTLVDCGITPFIVSTEPGVGSSLGDVPADKLHWKYIPPATPDWADLIDNAKTINSMSFEALTKMKDMGKQKYSQFIELLSTFANFKCDRTGETYGSVDSWGTDRAIVVDSLSGLNIMAMDLVVGAKPVKSPGDWGVAMDNLERLINRLTCGSRCHFVLIGHLEREKDELTGGTNLMASTLGQKLAPKLPRFFDDVVQARREGSTFYWSTSNPSIDLKSRHLGFSDKLLPSFSTVVEAWKKQGGVIANGVDPSPAP